MEVGEKMIQDSACVIKRDDAAHSTAPAALRSGVHGAVVMLELLDAICRERHTTQRTE